MSELAKRFMTISVWVTIILFVARCMIDLGEITTSISQRDYLNCSYSIYGYAGEAIGVAAIFMALFNKWLWKKKPFYFLTGELPILAKHYKGTITFVWNNAKQTKNSEIWIDQTFLNISVKLGTIESTSNSITATIENVNNEQQLIYTYLNTPKAELQDRSVIHYGTAMLCVDDSKRLSGNYYTSRSTKGSMIFQAVESAR